MGATGTHREKGMSDREFFEKELPIGLTQHGRVLDCATMPTSGEWQRVFYAAVQNNDDAPYAPGKTWALVVLMHWSPNADYFNFTYKDMSDESGPAEDLCPARILDLLSPTDSEYAVEWRKRCRENAAKKARAKLKVGDVIAFDSPYTFANDRKVRRFRFLGKRAWAALDDEDGHPPFTCRLPATWWERSWTKEA